MIQSLVVNSFHLQSFSKDSRYFLIGIRTIGIFPSKIFNSNILFVQLPFAVPASGEDARGALGPRGGGGGGGGQDHAQVVHGSGRQVVGTQLNDVWDFDITSRN